jgi:hypothetical protein
MPEFIEPVLGAKMIVFAKISPIRLFTIQSVPRDAGFSLFWMRSVPEFIDPVFTKTSPKRSFSLNRKRAFWLVFAKTGSIISGTELGLVFKYWDCRDAGFHQAPTPRPLLVETTFTLYTSCSMSSCSVEIKGSNYNETYVWLKKTNALK